MTRLTDRLERDLREIAAGADPSTSAWDSIVARLDEGDAVEAAFESHVGRTRSTRRAWSAVAAAVTLVIVGSIAVLTTDDDDRSISAADLGLTTTFLSPRHGYSVEHADADVVTAAEQLWAVGLRPDEWFDVVETGTGAVFRAASTAFPNRVAVDELADEQVAAALPDGCGVPRDRQAAITIDGESGRVAECPRQIEATVVAGARLYLFTLSSDRSDARAVFDAYLATIELTPETAVEVPAMTSTFVSPTYGYTFAYLDRGGLAPATERWDPIAGRVGAAFDGVETGLGAYFTAASVEAPVGVSIDEWVDEHVSACGTRRSPPTVAAITIDGHAGRRSECANRIEATVVAGRRLYLFALGHERHDAQALFEAWIATVELTPDTAM